MYSARVPPNDASRKKRISPIIELLESYGIGLRHVTHCSFVPAGATSPCSIGQISERGFLQRISMVKRLSVLSAEGNLSLTGRLPVVISWLSSIESLRLPSSRSGFARTPMQHFLRQFKVFTGMTTGRSGLACWLLFACVTPVNKEESWQSKITHWGNP